MMDMITFRFLISLVLFEKLEMRLMDIEGISIWLIRLIYLYENSRGIQNA